RRHTRSTRDWSSDVCSSDLNRLGIPDGDGQLDGRKLSAKGAEQRRQEVDPWRVAGTHPHPAPVVSLEGVHGGFGFFDERQDTPEIGRASCRESEWTRSSVDS